ncbi:hypothetical protein IGB42_02314 [Andreprevotia sp. IGB-42]|uniref:hypothetical protein n=1 Tax=Andreprevotia sp. IGB-42 TaxID=2497473 RepID=UPI00135A19C8|nr:hypothetical protein [Andreprevotia sp. IGB-42]KAF0813385.1 hypothetical protein IGB42_02314 [Andreprevotia sp. IGB-42]
MSVDPVSRLPAILALLRQQISAGSAGKASSHQRNRDKKLKAPSKQAGDLERKLVARLDAITPDDPRKARKVFAAFIEATLLAELGETLANDAGFHQMVDTICEQMMREPTLQADIESAIIQLIPPSD